jgi:hypothetical protein
MHRVRYRQTICLMAVGSISCILSNYREDGSACPARFLAFVLSTNLYSAWYVPAVERCQSQEEVRSFLKTLGLDVNMAATTAL